MDVTTILAREYVKNFDWFLSAIPQRLDADRKINASIKIAMKHMRTGVLSNSTPVEHETRGDFPSDADGRSPVWWKIEREILGIWVFQDDNRVLDSDEFKGMVSHLTQDLDASDMAKPNSMFPQKPPPIETRSLESLSASAKPLPSLFRERYDIEDSKLPPATLRPLMGLVVDLIMVLERLFWILFRRNVPSLSIDEIQDAFNQYNISGGRTKVHQEIRAYLKDRNLTDPQDALTEAKRLIGAHRIVGAHQRKGISFEFLGWMMAGLRRWSCAIFNLARVGGQQGSAAWFKISPPKSDMNKYHERERGRTM